MSYAHIIIMANHWAAILVHAVQDFLQVLSCHLQLATFNFYRVVVTWDLGIGSYSRFLQAQCTRPKYQAAEMGKRVGSFPGSRDVWGPAIAQKYWKWSSRWLFFWPQICINPFSIGDHWGSLRRSPGRLEGWWGGPLPTFPPSRRIQNEVVTGPHDNGFTGPAVALDGHAKYYAKSVMYTCIDVSATNLDTTGAARVVLFSAVSVWGSGCLFVCFFVCK